jgi:Flp pilus assembly pilin Flp
MLSYLKGTAIYLRARFAREDGAVATEYGLLLVLIAVGIVAAAVLLIAAINGAFTDATDELNSAPRP